MIGRKHIPHYAMVLPFMALFATFFLYPIASGLYYSFFDWNASSRARFVGFDNYQHIVASRDFHDAMINLASLRLDHRAAGHNRRLRSRLAGR